MKRILRAFLSVIALTITTAVLTASPSWAANTPDLTQVINSGSLALDIKDASRDPVTSPTFGLSALTFSFDCQVSTGTLGTDSQRIYVENPGAADNGWTVTIAATSGATSTWSNTGNTKHFDFNDPTSAGCSDGADADTYGGQMTLDPSVSTLTTDCASCTTTGITEGSSTAFAQGTTDSVTLLNASSASDDAGRWYLTGVAVNQTIPAEQAVDSYSINLTATVTAS